MPKSEVIEKAKKEWFVEWFDTPFYHILYKKRDFLEAQNFILALAERLQFKQEHTFMDLACGKGRHSIFLNEKGFDVVGLDLSHQNIEYAKQFSNERLAFFEHDMRAIFAENRFDFVLNLFTSFGYFEDDAQNLAAIKAAAMALKPGGKLVLDYMNSTKAVKTLAPFYEKTVDEIDFKITKFVINGFILKNINFDFEGQSYQFQERVKAIELEDFMAYFKAADLKVESVFGDYALNDFNKNDSDRMIFVVQKG
jgi:SAM-dependent methyltransferase